jgi:multicomponent Na+:H+ antiporter subunit B
VSRALRIGLFLVSAAGLGAFVVWGLAGLPAFGEYAGPYGNLIVDHVKSQRHIANAVTAVVFDYRGFDTMGEELMLFGAASATALLLRETRERATEAIVDRVRSDAVSAFALLAAVATFLLALNVVAHGFLTPGGGFQGGVVVAAALAFVFLGVEYHGFHRLTFEQLSEPVEAIGAGGYVGLGIASLGLGMAFLQNFMPLGTFGRLTSGGSAILVNWSSGIAVAGGFAVLFAEYLREAESERYGRRVEA